MSNYDENDEPVNHIRFPKIFPKHDFDRIFAHTAVDPDAVIVATIPAQRLVKEINDSIRIVQFFANQPDERISEEDSDNWQYHIDNIYRATAAQALRN